MEGKGHASGVTPGRSPRMLSTRRIAARGGGARTGRRGEAERARSRQRGLRGEARARLSKSGRARGAEGVRALLWDAPASLGPALETEGRVGCATLVPWVTLHYSPCPLQARPSRAKGSGRKGLKVFVGSWGGKLVARGEPDNYSGQLPFSRVPGND